MADSKLEVQDKKEVQPQEEKTPDPSPLTTAPQFLPLQGFLNINNPTGKESTQLQDIWEHFVKHTEPKTPGNILAVVRSVENKLSPAKLGETRLGKIHNFVKLQEQIRGLEAEREQLLE
jgi:hypothetical protein